MSVKLQFDAPDNKLKFVGLVDEADAFALWVGEHDLAKFPGGKEIGEIPPMRDWFAFYIIFNGHTLLLAKRGLKIGNDTKYPNIRVVKRR